MLPLFHMVLFVSQFWHSGGGIQLCQQFCNFLIFVSSLSSLWIELTTVVTFDQSPFSTQQWRFFHGNHHQDKITKNGQKKEKASFNLFKKTHQSPWINFNLVVMMIWSNVFGIWDFLFKIMQNWKMQSVSIKLPQNFDSETPMVK